MYINKEISSKSRPLILYYYNFDEQLIFESNRNIYIYFFLFLVVSCDWVQSAPVLNDGQIKIDRH